MTLDEYFNQTPPTKNNVVSLKVGEYFISPPVKVCGDIHRRVYINGLSFEYLLINDSKTLFTTNENGDKVGWSCFMLE